MVRLRGLCDQLVHIDIKQCCVCCRQIRLGLPHPNRPSWLTGSSSCACNPKPPSGSDDGSRVEAKTVFTKVNASFRSDLVTSILLGFPGIKEFTERSEPSLYVDSLTFSGRALAPRSSGHRFESCQTYNKRCGQNNLNQPPLIIKSLNK